MDTDQLYRLLVSDKLNLLDRGNVIDYFLFQTLDILKGKKTEFKPRQWVNLMIMYDFNVPEGHELKGFFFALSELVSLEFGIKLFANEAISREEFEESFKETYANET